MSLVHKLALGTVQLGLHYGINNKIGKPNKEESFAILRSACQHGITTFDTAHAYGDAEEVLGEFLEKDNAKEKVKIITKLKANVLSEEVGGNVRESLERLRATSVNGCLLHNPEQLKDRNMIDALCKVKNLGLVKNIGVSVYTPEDAVRAAGMKEIDYIQIPYNIFDQRLDKTDFFELAKKHGKTVFARSPFLQGLLLMDVETLPLHLKKAGKYLNALDEIIKKYSLSRRQAALLFSLNHSGIHYTLFGVEALAQLEENIKIAKQEVDCQALIQECKKAFSDIEEAIISPNVWKKESST